MAKPSELASVFGVPPGLVDIIEGIDDLDKSKSKSGPGANNKKQANPFDGASGQPGKPGAESGMPPGAGGPAGPAGAMVSDDAMKQMQQQQADQQAAEMEARQAKDAAEEAEREHQKELRTKAEKEVADDLNDKYLDQDDKVEFYPRMESFGRFVSEGKYVPHDFECPKCGEVYKDKITSLWDKNADKCKKCGTELKRIFKEASADGYKRTPSGQKSVDGYTYNDDDDKCSQCGKSPAPIYAAGRDNSVFLCRKCAKEAGIKESTGK